MLLTMILVNFIVKIDADLNGEIQKWDIKKCLCEKPAQKKNFLFEFLFK